MSRTRTRPRGFASWAPRPDTLALLGKVKSVLREYEAHLPMTCRQIFYRLVGAHGFEKSEAAYARLCETLNRARRAGLVPFDAIRDDGATSLDPNGWSSAPEFLGAYRAAAEAFELDRQTGQPVHLVLMAEAAGMAPMLARVVHPYGVRVVASGGFDSLTDKYALALDLADRGAVEVLHVGDHDPSGVHLFAALAEDVGAMMREFGIPARDLHAACRDT